MRFRLKIDNQVFKKIEKRLESVAEGASREQVEELGDKVVREMKSMIAKGISPIEGNGRFPAYKWQGVKGKYPATFKSIGKRDRPVNLHLHGDFLAALRGKAVKVGKQWALSIGWDEESERVKELGHRRGANGQPKRPIIPIGNESFAVKIQRLIIDTFNKTISKK